MTVKERARHEISEAFDFLRFLIKNPKEIAALKNESEINILCKDLPQKTAKPTVRKRKAKLPQSYYVSEHTFHKV